MFVASLATPVSGEPLTVSDGPAPSRQAIQLSAAQIFAFAEEMVKIGKVDDAINVLKLVTHDNNSDYRAEARVRVARLLVAKGNFIDAAVWYRKLLDEKSDAAAVRMELAALLTRIGDVEGARRQLRQAQATGLPPEVALAVRQYVAALRSQKPWGGSLELAFAPDSNINRATSAKTLDTVIAPLNLSRDAQQQSGIGLKESSQTYARLNVGKTWTLVPRLSSQATFYRARQFDDISGSAQLGIEWRIKGDRIIPAVGYTWRWYGGSLYARTQSLNIDWLHPAGKRAQFDTSASVNRVRYVGNSAQDGMIYTVALGYERAFSSRSGASISLSGNRQSARNPGYATKSGGLNGIYWHEIGKTTVFATLSGNRLEADDRLWLFPARRRDWYLRGGVGAVWRKIEVAGFSPVVRIAYEHNWSTVGIYDYHRISTDFGIARSF